MRNGQNKRMRGRNRNHKSHHSGGGGGGGGGGHHHNPLTRVYESNGPEVKIRGTAHHIAEKYLQLARDAQGSGDPVTAENHFQHAEHYLRMIAAAQEQFRAQNPYYQAPPAPGEIRDEAFDGEDNDEVGQGQPGQGQPQNQPPQGQQNFGSQQNQSAGLQQRPAAALSAPRAAAALRRPAAELQLSGPPAATAAAAPAVQPATAAVSAAARAAIRRRQQRCRAAAVVHHRRPAAAECAERRTERLRQPGRRPLSPSPAPASSRARRSGRPPAGLLPQDFRGDEGPEPGNS